MLSNTIQLTVLGVGMILKTPTELARHGQIDDGNNFFDPPARIQANETRQTILESQV